jgi:hypothetical protein
MKYYLLDKIINFEQYMSLLIFLVKLSTDAKLLLKVTSDSVPDYVSDDTVNELAYFELASVHVMCCN